MRALRLGALGVDGAGSGRGKVFSWTVTHQTLVPPFADDLPYAVVVVELEEGPRLVTAVRGIEHAALRLGLPVEVRVATASRNRSGCTTSCRAR